MLLLLLLQQLLLFAAVLYSVATASNAVLFCSLAILDPRVGHTIDVVFLFISVLCHSD